MASIEEDMLKALKIQLNGIQDMMRILEETIKGKTKANESSSSNNIVLNPHYERMFSELKIKIEEELSCTKLTCMLSVCVRTWLPENEKEKDITIRVSSNTFIEFMKFYKEEYTFSEIIKNNVQCYTLKGEQCGQTTDDCCCSRFDYIYGYNVSPK